MITLLIILVVIVAVALGSIVMGVRQRHKVNQRLDRLANRVSGAMAPASRSPVAAVERLEAVMEVRETEQQLQGVERRYEAALEAVDWGVVVVDETEEVVFCNLSASWYLEGRHGEAVVGQKIDDLIHAAALGERVSETVTLFGPPRRVLFVSALPIVDKEELCGAIALIHDVTALEQTNAIRRDFVSNISHELRTPIGAVSLLAETLIGEHDPAVIDSLADRLRIEAERLAATVQDLLELSQIEHSGDSEFAWVVIQGVVSGAHDRVRAAAAQSDVSIRVEMPEQDLTVRGDRRQLTSAVFNLLDNAIKFSNSGGGTIQVTVREAHAWVEVEVDDAGIGIPRQDLDRIFERFYRVDRGRSRTSGGTGLGLSMVHHIVANHAGRVSVTSTEGEGTTFTMELPLAPTDISTAAPAAPDDGTSAAPAAPGVSTAPGESTAPASAAPAAPGESTS